MPIAGDLVPRVRCLSFIAVVDPGLNYFGWSLDEARAYLRPNTFPAESEIATETLRYSTGIPGPALGYRIGHDNFRALPTRGEEALGERFDLHKNHALVFDCGELSHSVLSDPVDRFIERKSRER
jgi:uncharacterized protein (DUF885 family)